MSCKESGPESASSLKSLRASASLRRVSAATWGSLPATKAWKAVSLLFREASSPVSRSMRVQTMELGAEKSRTGRSARAARMKFTQMGAAAREPVSP